jgi:hypothetical protein
MNGKQDSKRVEKILKSVVTINDDKEDLLDDNTTEESKIET